MPESREDRLLRLIREILDQKKEKKDTNKSFNGRIKQLEVEIKHCVRDDVNG